MKISLLTLIISFLLFGCSTKVLKDESDFSIEQVELKDVDPLAQFSSKEENSFKNFEKFHTYNEKKIKSKSIPKEEINLPKVRYYVQVGITDSFDDISQLKNQLIYLFPDEKIETTYEPPFYRILIGPFDTKSKANEIFSILERKNFSSIRIRTETAK